MSETTTLKLPDHLKKRVNELASITGQSPHAFMVAAIEQQAQLAERRRDFVGSALLAEQEIARYGLVHDGDEVLAYLKATLEGQAPKRPRRRKL